MLLSKVGSNLNEIKLIIDLCAYCYSDLLPIVKSCTEFEVRESDSDETSIHVSKT